jgi:hypothetical protein
MPDAYCLIRKAAKARHMRTIELIGLPGSGKTKVRRELVKSSRDQSPRILDLESALCEAIRTHGQTVPSDEKMRTADVLDLSQIKRKRLIGRAFHKTGLRFDRLASFAANYPELLDIIMRIERTRGEGDQWALVNQWLFNLFARYDYISEQLNSSVVLLLDEGFAGRAVTMFAYDRPTASRRSIAEYVRSIPKPDGVVYLSCRPETCRRARPRPATDTTGRRAGDLRRHPAPFPHDPRPATIRPHAE